MKTFQDFLNHRPAPFCIDDSYFVKEESGIFVYENKDGCVDYFEEEKKLRFFLQKDFPDNDLFCCRHQVKYRGKISLYYHVQMTLFNSNMALSYLFENNQKDELRLRDLNNWGSPSLSSSCLMEMMKLIERFLFFLENESRDRLKFIVEPRKIQFETGHVV